MPVDRPEIRGIEIPGWMAYGREVPLRGLGNALTRHVVSMEASVKIY
jgi:hypothetical protein